MWGSMKGTMEDPGKDPHTDPCTVAIMVLCWSTCVCIYVDVVFSSLKVVL